MSEQPKASTPPLLVLIGGAPGSGKTTLAQHLSKTLSLPLISRDMIRHVVLDAFKVETWEQSKRYSGAIYGIFFGLIEQFLKANVSIIADCNFYHGESERSIQPILSETGAHAVLIHMSISPELSTQRFIERAQQSNHRRGAFDTARIEEIKAGAFHVGASQYEPLELGIPTLVVDTTTGYVPDISTIKEFVRSA